MMNLIAFKRLNFPCGEISTNVDNLHFKSTKNAMKSSSILYICVLDKIHTYDII